MERICNRCKKESGRLFPAFGKLICEECKDNRPNKGTGNSGVGIKPIIYHPAPHDNGVALLLVKKSDGLFGKLFFEHYPGSKGIPGRSFCFLAYFDGELVGIIGANSPPCNYKKFRAYFDIDNDKVFMNNNVFRLIKTQRNLGTQVLKAFRNTIKSLYYPKYGDEVMGLVTFVEPPRTGAMYKADNWDYLGMTKGIRMKRDSNTWEKCFYKDVKKHIFALKF